MKLPLINNTNDGIKAPIPKILKPGIKITLLSNSEKIHFNKPKEPNKTLVIEKLDARENNNLIPSNNIQKEKDSKSHLNTILESQNLEDNISIANNNNPSNLYNIGNHYNYRKFMNETNSKIGREPKLIFTKANFNNIYKSYRSSGEKINEDEFLNFDKTINDLANFHKAKTFLNSNYLRFHSIKDKTNLFSSGKSEQKNKNYFSSNNIIRKNSNFQILNNNNKNNYNSPMVKTSNSTNTNININRNIDQNNLNSNTIYHKINDLNQANSLGNVYNNTIGANIPFRKNKIFNENNYISEFNANIKPNYSKNFMLSKVKLLHNHKQSLEYPYYNTVYNTRFFNKRKNQKQTFSRINSSPENYSDTERNLSSSLIICSSNTKLKQNNMDNYTKNPIINNNHNRSNSNISLNKSNSYCQNTPIKNFEKKINNSYNSHNLNSCSKSKLELIQEKFIEFPQHQPHIYI